MGEGVQFGRFHTRTSEREREGGREGEDQLGCVGVLVGKMSYGPS